MALQWNFKIPTNSEIYSKVYRGEKTWYLEFALKHFRRQRVLKKGKRIGEANMAKLWFWICMMGIWGGLVSWGCHKKVTLTLGAWNSRNLLYCDSGDLKFETKVSAGPYSLCMLKGNVLPHLFQLPLEAFLGLWLPHPDLCFHGYMVSFLYLCLLFCLLWEYLSFDIRPAG